MGYGGKVEKYRTKSIKLFLVGVKEKLPTKNAKQGAKGGKEVGEICPGTDGVENKWKK